MFKRASLLLLACTMIYIFSGCSPSPVDTALKATDPSKGIKAVHKITDQKDLGKIAKEAQHKWVRKEAIYNLTDQTVLKDMALKDKDASIRKAAINKLTDLVILIELTSGDDPQIRKAALDRLADSSLLPKIAAETQDKKIQSIYKFIRALDDIPKKDRNRFTASLLPVINILIMPEVVDRVGNVIAVTTTWSSKSKQYIGPKVSGERFYCSITLDKMSKPLSKSWSTYFPSTYLYNKKTKKHFISARTNPGTLLQPVFKQLPQPLLKEIIGKSTDWDISKAVIENMTDKSLLADIASEHWDSSVSKAAQKRLDSLR